MDRCARWVSRICSTGCVDEAAARILRWGKSSGADWLVRPGGPAQLETLSAETGDRKTASFFRSMDSAAGDSQMLIVSDRIKLMRGGELSYVHQEKGLRLPVMRDDCVWRPPGVVPLADSATP